MTNRRNRTMITLATATFWASCCSTSSATLVYHWKLDDGAPSSTAVESVSSLDGTLQFFDDLNTAWTSDTPSGTGGSLTFDGTDSRVNAGTPTINWPAISISAWVNTTSTTGSMRIVSKDQIGVPGNFILRSNGGDWLFQVSQSNTYTGHNATWSSTAPNDGQWHHFVGVLDQAQVGAEIRLYVDNVLRATAPWSGTTLDDSDNELLVIGASSDVLQGDVGHVFDGLIDDVKIYNSVLSVADIDALFQLQGSEPVPEPSSLVLALVGLRLMGHCRRRKIRRPSD